MGRCQRAQRRLRRLLLVSPVLGVIATAGCARQQQGPFKMPPVPVETAEAAMGQVVDRFTAVGTIEADQAITVVAEIDGRVVALPFAEGAAVPAGALLARLDDQQLQAEAARAEAVVEQRRVTHQRIAAIVDQKAGAPQDLDDASAAVKIAEAELALVRARLAKTRITAPFDGIVGARRVSVGAYLRPGTAITDLAQIRKLRIQFSAPERYLGQLHRGAAVTVTTSAFPDLEVQAAIDVVEPVLDQGTRTARIVARADNPEGRLRPGMSALVSVLLSERRAAITLHSEAVFAEGTQTFVYVVGPDSTVQRAAVTLGTRLPDAVEILDGLAADALVVRTGHQKLFPGAKVRPVAAGQADATGAAR